MRNLTAFVKLGGGAAKQWEVGSGKWEVGSGKVGAFGE